MHWYIISLVLIALFTFPASADARTPNDPFVEQWSFTDTGTFHAWDYARGSQEVVVAIIDNGFDSYHPDLRSNVWTNVDEIAGNGIDDDRNGYIDDVYGWNFVPRDLNGDNLIKGKEILGSNDPRPRVQNVSGEDKSRSSLHHGTLVAGIIGATANNRQGIAGINWNVKLMNLRLLASSGTGNLGSLARAIRYAVDNGADVINFSIVGSVINQEILSTIDYAYSKGVVLVGAAGNDAFNLDSNPRYPICADREAKQKILGVSAINRDHYLAGFSNYGASCIDLTAPGTDIVSTLRYAPQAGLEDKVSGGWHGTSFATPFVSATAALIKSIQPSWGPDEIYDTILSSTHVTPPVITPTYRALYGNGLLQIDKAVALALETAPKVVGVTGARSIDPASGLTLRRTFLGEEAKTTVPPLKGVDHIATYPSSRGTLYVTTEYIPEENVVRVRQLNDAFQMIHTFGVSARGPLYPVVGDLGGTAAPEIVLAPQYRSETLFTVYSQVGSIVSAVSQDEAHAGAVAAISPDASSTSNVTVAFTMPGQDGVYVDVYNLDGTQLSTFTNTKLRSVSSIAIGDLDTDGLPEIALGAGSKDAPWISYHEMHGDLLRQFKAYDVPRHGGVVVHIGDFTADGAANVMTALRDGDDRIRIWNNTSRKLQQWKAPAASGGRLFVPTF